VRFIEELGPKAVDSLTDLVDDSNLTDAMRGMTGPDVKSMMGFLPPAAERDQITKMRSRKSRAHKTLRGYGAMDAS
jgi:hypothetical protein